MRCHICDQSAQHSQSVRDATQIWCEFCGVYKISGTAVAFMYRDIRVFDVAATREWLEHQREAGVTVPVITVDTARWD